MIPGGELLFYRYHRGGPTPRELHATRQSSRPSRVLVRVGYPPGMWGTRYDLSSRGAFSWDLMTFFLRTFEDGRGEVTEVR